MPWSNSDLVTAATAAIALAGLLRPEFTKLIRRWKTTVDLHPAGRIEIGFSNFGPTVGIQGTLRAIGGDVFVISGKIQIERLADHLRHEFEWAVFRPHAFSFGAANDEGYEIASGFYLNESAPRRINIQFHDSTTAARFQQILPEVKRIWTEHLAERQIMLATLTPREFSDVYQQFHSTTIPQLAPLHSAVDRTFYWNEGTYRMTIEFKTSRPEKILATTFDFALSSTKSESLRVNAYTCLMVACDVPNATFSFAYPVYQNLKTR